MPILIRLWIFTICFTWAHNSLLYLRFVLCSVAHIFGPHAQINLFFGQNYVLQYKHSNRLMESQNEHARNSSGLHASCNPFFPGWIQTTHIDQIHSTDWWGHPCLNVCWLPCYRLPWDACCSLGPCSTTSFGLWNPELNINSQKETHALTGSPNDFNCHLGTVLLLLLGYETLR